MDAAVRRLVRQRARNRCEYCLRREFDAPLIKLQLEHVIPTKHGGTDDFENLAMACAECNLHKGSNLTGIDPESNQITPLFDPRRQVWNEHFRCDGLQVVGVTAVGRTTVRVLDMNSPARIRVRSRTHASGS